MGMFLNWPSLIPSQKKIIHSVINCFKYNFYKMPFIISLICSVPNTSKCVISVLYILVLQEKCCKMFIGSLYTTINDLVYVLQYINDYSTSAMYWCLHAKYIIYYNVPVNIWVLLLYSIVCLSKLAVNKRSRMKKV